MYLGSFTEALFVVYGVINPPISDGPEFIYYMEEKVCCSDLQFIFNQSGQTALNIIIFLSCVWGKGREKEKRI